jgi:hypothetical protein
MQACPVSPLPFVCGISEQRPPAGCGVPLEDGYPELTEAVRSVIDEAFAVVRHLLASGRYRRVYYSANADGTLATRIFKPGEDVKDYIVTELRKLGD